MHPLKISLYIIVALLALLGLTFLSQVNPLPDGKEQDGFSVNNSVIKYPTTATFFKDATISKDQKKSFEGIVENIESVVEDQKPAIPDFTKIDSTKIERIAYPGNSEEFIQKLRNQLQAANCRIIHYGDSQLEGDRISAYLRNRLQGLYGGSGPGFIPIKQEYHQVSAVVIPSENWLRYASFDPSKPLFANKNYGAYLSVSRFTPASDSIPDSLALRELQPVMATIANLNSESFSSMYQQLQPKVIIFQYGGNTVPYLKDSLAVKNYASYLKNQINWVRRKAPEASIFFVGPSDMATTVNGELKSYALLPYLDIELKQSCLSNNVAYWSMFKAMGGENSMPYWVDQNLVGSDYTHFTPLGTKIISELFFTALHMDLISSK